MLHMRRSRFLLLFALPAACCFAAHAQAPAHTFTAQWITAAGAPGHDPAVLRLRKEIVLATAPAHFVVHVSADNQFLLIVNNQRIGQGPAFGGRAGLRR